MGSPRDLRQSQRPWSCAIVREDDHNGKILETRLSQTPRPKRPRVTARGPAARVAPHIVLQELFERDPAAFVWSSAISMLHGEQKTYALDTCRA
jgi:hypothetical protein